ncbi:MAG: HTH domain-containing protein [Paludibacteraceae bacterium]|nr:HTH domain-containing protein [Paludibacteraceae bacterium]
MSGFGDKVLAKEVIFLNAVERRERLLQILALRGRSTFRALSEELGVSERTIMRDVDVLSTYKPVSVISGKHGGVFISDYSSFYNFSMKSYEIDLLQKIIADMETHSCCSLSKSEIQLLKDIVASYSKRNNQKGK